MLSNSIEIKVFGGISIGYALGKIGAGIMSYKISRKTWGYSEDLIDWDKIAEYAEDNIKENT